MGNTQLTSSVALREEKHAMAQNGTDRRAQRTRIFIQNALIELTEKGRFDAISVQDISRQALINRATFYRYYKDKYNLVEEIFKGALRKMAVDWGPPLVIQDVSDLAALPRLDDRYQAAWVSLFEHFASNSRMYSAMLSGKGSAWFQARMRDHMIKFIAEKVRGKRVRTNPNAVPVDIARCLFASAIIALAYTWLEGGMKHTASQIATWFRRIAYVGYVAALLGIER